MKCTHSFVALGLAIAFAAPAVAGDKCKKGEWWNDKYKKCVDIKDKGYKCKKGEWWDDKYKKCVKK